MLDIGNATEEPCLSDGKHGGNNVFDKSKTGDPITRNGCFQRERSSFEWLKRVPGVLIKIHFSVRPDYCPPWRFSLVWLPLPRNIQYRGFPKRLFGHSNQLWDAKPLTSSFWRIFAECETSRDLRIAVVHTRGAGSALAPRPPLMLLKCFHYCPALSTYLCLFFDRLLPWFCRNNFTTKLNHTQMT